MALDGGAMIVAHEKHEHALYDDFTSMLARRVSEGYWYDGDDALVANTIVTAMGAPSFQENDPEAVAAVEKAAERFLTKRREYEYEGFEVRHPIRRA